MTKRDLVKWLEVKKNEAVAKAEISRKAVEESAREAYFNKIGVDEFLDGAHPLLEQLLGKYKEFIDHVATLKDIDISPYHYFYGYYSIEDRYGDKKKLREHITDLIRIKTDEYSKTLSDAREAYSNVHRTYNTVIETVKNLPTAKDGIEYLKKLGFDVSEIQPAEKKKQLPATLEVNVDTRYLLLDKAEMEDEE